MNPRKRLIWLFYPVILLAAFPFPVRAAGPAYVTGPDATQPGQPYNWAENSVRYKTDQGKLGSQTNTQADALVASAFLAWQNVSTASISFPLEGKLDFDVTANNVLAFQNALGNCSDTSQPTNAVVYDVDGSVMAALGLDKNSVLGFAGLVCTNDTAGTYTRGWALLNGRFIDGQPDSPGHKSVPLDDFRAVFIHEFGHLIGLGHSQINLSCMEDAGCSAEDLAGLPTMFPLFLNSSQATLKLDDIASVSMLYPASSFASTTGRIRGRVLFSDGITPAQGFNVIARQTANPRSKAASSVSGYLYTAGVGNPLVPDGNNVGFFYGSHDNGLIGYFDIAGLPPGSYTLEVEAINNSGANPFIGDSYVGPIGEYLGFQFKMPGICDLQYLNNPPLPSDNCSSQTTLSLGAGQVLSTNTDIILIGTPPRFDAWEENP